MAKVLYGIEELRGALPKGTALVATVGFFDGMHRGHQALIQRTHQGGIGSLRLFAHHYTSRAPSHSASTSKCLSTPLTPTSYRIELLSLPPRLLTHWYPLFQASGGTNGSGVLSSAHRAGPHPPSARIR